MKSLIFNQMSVRFTRHAPTLMQDNWAKITASVAAARAAQKQSCADGAVGRSCQEDQHHKGAKCYVEVPLAAQHRHQKIYQQNIPEQNYTKKNGATGQPGTGAGPDGPAAAGCFVYLGMFLIFLKIFCIHV